MARLPAFLAVATLGALSAAATFPPIPLARLAAPSGSSRTRHLSELRRWPAFISPAAADPVISPVQYGADPTGVADSTAAFALTLAALFNASSQIHPLANGIADLGGATVDLGGGTYLISQPIAIPQLYGNFRIIHGTVRASPSFPKARFVIEVGGGVPCTNSQKSCNQDGGF